MNEAGSIPRPSSGIIPRVAALIAATLLLSAAWSWLAATLLVRESRDASQRVGQAAAAVAANLDASLARFAEQAPSIRAGDISTTDKLTQTARLIRLQGLLPAGVTFLLTPDGQLQSASAPFAKPDAALGDAPWFRQALAASPGTLTAYKLDRPWFGIASGLVLSRPVLDPAGRPAGLVGAVLPSTVLEDSLAPAFLSPALDVTLAGGSPARPLATRPGLHPDESESPPPVLLALLSRLDAPAHWDGAAPLRGMDATVTVAMPAAAALKLDHLRAPLLQSGGLLALAWLLCAGAILLVRPRSAVLAERFGVDWVCELDASGVVQAGTGALPEVLRHGRGQALALALGLPAEAPATAAIAAALRGNAVLPDLCVSAAGPDGTVREYRLRLEPAARRFICAGRDITAARLAEAGRAEAEATLARLRGEQERLLASLGHDFRTPMTSIMGICELLLDGELDPEQRTWLERVQASCGALLAMLSGLLEVAGGEPGRGALLREPVDVIALVQELVDLLRPQARDKGLDLQTRCDDLLRGHWLLDPARLRQVVFNLAANAVKFTESGRVEIHASAVEQDGENRLRIAVADTGPGIDPADRSEIFERFRRGRAQQGAQGGLGLGLALCQENAQLMGGSITLESAMGVGSEFTFECPAERVPAQDRPMPFAGRTALIVADDDPATRALAGQLGELGLTVETAPDGYLGLALAERLEAQRGAVDLVVLQGNLPGMPGEVFVIRLRRTPFGRRAIVLWLGAGADGADVDATIASPDPYQVAGVARQLLAERPTLDVLEPDVAVARGGRVLLAEDDKANRTLLSAALTRRGYAVFTASNGEQAVRLASRDSFDAILMDLQMPGLDGFEATRRIRAMAGRGATLPIIALTALQGARLRQRCAEAGFSAVLEKPVNLDRLTTALSRWIGSPDAEGQADTGSADAADYVADVSVAFLEEMVAVVGLDRARACVTEFVNEAVPRCRRLGELLPGWEVDAILRSCEEISGMAETCGALALGELLEEIADAASRDDRESTERLIGRMDVVIARLPRAMTACLDDIASRWPRGSKAA